MVIVGEIHDERRGLAPRIARLALATIVVGVLLTWATDGPVRLDGLDGPNDGWLILIVALFALGWTPSMARMSWIGTIGVLGASIVIASTALTGWRENREVLGATVGVGLVLVLIGAAGLAWSAVTTALAITRPPRKED